MILDILTISSLALLASTSPLGSGGRTLFDQPNGNFYDPVSRLNNTTSPSDNSTSKAPLTGFHHHQNGSNVDSFKVLNISSPDGSAQASFIGLGAAITNLYIKDRNGTFRDVILGYDNRTDYLTDAANPYFGPVVGRYANRIRNSSFSIPPQQDLSSAPNSSVSHVTPNEHNGENTLHGGIAGTSRSGFNLLEHGKDKIVFGLLDYDGVEGFPGTVYAKVSYTLTNNSKWLIEMDALAFSPTPILLSSHVYWNLDGYIGDRYSTEKNGSYKSILDHELMIKSGRFIEIDSILVPTGVIGTIDNSSALNFNEARSIGSQFNETLGFCGPSCIGYDNAWIYDNHTTEDTVMTLASPHSGIKLSVKTDQTAAQVYTCGGQKGLIPRKVAQGGPSTAYDQYSCIVLEQQGWIGGINQPQWGQDQIYGPDRPYHWWSEYSFTNDA